jgi:hypothetical protein
MRRYACGTCAAEVFFDSTSCERCGTEIGYDLAADTMTVVDGGHRRCAQATISGCNWLVDAPGDCASCARTRTRPNDADLEGMTIYPVAERAKRHLIRDLTRLGFSLDGVTDGDPGLRFDLLSSANEDVTIGHADGVITIDVAEGNHSLREEIRARLAEPYRTMLGHFRHESGHYFEWSLLERTGWIESARALFGDERADYQAAISAHYSSGAPDGWQTTFISEYATMHPYEDFAETWAHYLHLRDALETADAFGLVGPPPSDAPFDEVIRRTWLPLATSMNVMNRSLGQSDFYPFTLPDRVIEKLSFVHGLAGR